MAESKGGFPYLKQTLIGAGSGVAILALIIGGFSLGGVVGEPQASETPSASASVSASPSPSPSDVRACSVAELAQDPRLATLSATVLNADTNEVLFDRNGTTPAATASVMKVVTASAALLTLGPNYRIDTRVYADPAEPGTIILVGGGDVTLSRTAAGQQSVYRDAPKLSTLAVAVKQKMAGTPITKIILDSTLFTGPKWDASWERSEQTEGYMSEVTALQVDGDRSNPAAETSWRSAKPVANAGKYFKAALGTAATGATVVEGVMPAGATQIAKVQSQPISKWITHMLQVSDNTQAEALARLVSLDLGFDGSFASINTAFKKALAGTELDASNMTFRDGSGLSDFNSVSPKYIADLMVFVQKGEGIFSLVNQSLPVSGESGSLATRFKGENSDAIGKVHAKTGWIKRGYTLAGFIQAKDGANLTFAVYALGNVTSDAKQAIDDLVTGFYRCGDQLSNQ